MRRIIAKSLSVLMILSFMVVAFPQASYAKVKESGKYPTSPGMILVTSDFYKGLIPTGHAAIVWETNFVVEARAKGVVKGRNNWRSQKSRFWGLQVLQKKKGKPLSKAKQNAAAKWCYKQLGKKYNFNYLNTYTRRQFYCSHLVWAAYKDNFGINLNTLAFAGWYKYWGYANPVHPLELVSSPYTRTDYTFKR